MQILKAAASYVKPTCINLIDRLVLYRRGDWVRVMPIVDGIPLPNGRGYRVLCPYCGRHHVHGLAGGTRVAECRTPAPPGLRSNEYYLRPLGSTAPFAGYGEVEEGSDVRQ